MAAIEILQLVAKFLNTPVRVSILAPEYADNLFSSTYVCMYVVH